MEQVGDVIILSFWGTKHARCQFSRFFIPFPTTIRTRLLIVRSNLLSSSQVKVEGYNKIVSVLRVRKLAHFFLFSLKSKFYPVVLFSFDLLIFHRERERALKEETTINHSFLLINRHKTPFSLIRL